MTSDPRWARVYADLVTQHRRDQRELAEIDSAICTAEENAIYADQNPKAYTAALRADRAKANGRLWVTKAEIDMVQCFLQQKVPYDITLDPAT